MNGRGIASARHNGLSLERVQRAAPLAESELHASVATYLTLSLPPEATFTTVPGGHKVITTVPGYQAGWPDLEVLFAGRGHYIELKRPGKRAEAHQRACHERIRRCGGKVGVATSLDEVEKLLTGWGVPIRARVAA